MTRSRAARSVRPLLACLLVGTLAACGGTTQRAAVQAPAIGNEWPRPASAQPPGSAADPWGPWIQEASRRFDVPERWIREVMRQESGGRAHVTSRAGAMGLMQVMPGTYAELARRHGLGPDAYHPWDNIMAGTAYIRQMYDLFGSPAFLAAYNAGPRRLEDFLWGGRGLPDETRNYVARVGPRIAGTTPGRRAAPEIYAAAEIPHVIPRGPRQGDRATMLALREQRRAVDPGIQVAQLPPGPVVRMEPIPDGSTAPPVQLAAAGPVVAMAPIATAADFQRRMEPIVSAGDPGTVQAEPLPPVRPSVLAAAPAPRGFGLIPQAQAASLAAPVRGGIATGGNWGVQVGAFASENLARAAAGQARDRIGPSGIRTVVEPVAQGRTTLFRARVVGLSGRPAAEQACERLRDRGACMIVAPGA